MESKTKTEQINDLIVTNETEVRHKVLSVVRLINIGYETKEALKIYNITIDQYRKYKPYWDNRL